MKARIFAAQIALVFVLALASCKSQPTSGTGQGTVAGIDAAKNEVTLDHGEIPGLMGAMTMTFVVSDPALLARTAPGAKVEFDVEVRDGAYIVTGIRPR